MRQGDWKLIVSKKDGQSELFNLLKDPLEKNDLASQETERVIELKAVLNKIATRDRKKHS